jgi:hypothetical protein
MTRRYGKERDAKWALTEQLRREGYRYLAPPNAAVRNDVQRAWPEGHWRLVHGWQLYVRSPYQRISTPELLTWWWYRVWREYGTVNGLEQDSSWNLLLACVTLEEEAAWEAYETELALAALAGRNLAVPGVVSR